MPPEQHAEATDNDVVRQVLAGDVNAFEILLKRYQSFVFKIAGRHVPPREVEGVAHDVFIQAYRSLSTYRRESEFPKWLAGICVRTCAGFWRTRYRSREVPISKLSGDHREWLENALSGRADREFREACRKDSARAILDWALSRMAAEDQLILELVHLEGHSIRETARLMGLSAANVKVRAFRARKRLKKLIEKQKGSEDE